MGMVEKERIFWIAKNGENLIAWDNISLPKGQYVVQIIQNENIFVFSSKL